LALANFSNKVANDKGRWHQQRQFFAPKHDAIKAQNSESLRTVVAVWAGIARGYL
jgi:hypothetical protein